MAGGDGSGCCAFAMVLRPGTTVRAKAAETREVVRTCIFEICCRRSWAIGSNENHPIVKRYGNSPRRKEVD